VEHLWVLVCLAALNKMAVRDSRSSLDLRFSISSTNPMSSGSRSIMNSLPDKSPSDDDVNAFVDDVLPENERVRFVRMMELRPEYQAQVSSYSAQNAALKAAYDPLLDCPAPSRLLAVLYGPRERGGQ
jgi:hypothetical protein